MSHNISLLSSQLYRQMLTAMSHWASPDSFLSRVSLTSLLYIQELLLFWKAVLFQYLVALSSLSYGDQRPHHLTQSRHCKTTSGGSHSNRTCSQGVSPRPPHAAMHFSSRHGCSSQNCRGIHWHNRKTDTSLTLYIAKTTQWPWLSYLL